MAFERALASPLADGREPDPLPEALQGRAMQHVSETLVRRLT